MHIRPVVACLLAAAMVASPAAAAVRGFPVGGFDRVRSDVPFDVRVRTGTAPSVRAAGPQDRLDRLEIVVRGGELVIGMRRGGWRWGRGEPVVIDVTAPALVGAVLRGPGNLAVDRVRAPRFTASLSGPGNLSVGRLGAGHVDLDVSGPGDIAVAGRAGSARMIVSGPGNIRAGRLALDTIDATVSGPGDIDAAAARFARVTVSGPGDVRIAGRPRCEVRKTGPGSVRCGG